MSSAPSKDIGLIPLSEVRDHGEFVYLSGTVGREDDGRIPDDFSRQAQLALAEVERLLAEAGAGLDTVLKTTVFITDREDFATMNAIYAEHLPEPWPTRTTLVTDLALPELRFEIELVAHRKD